MDPSSQTTWNIWAKVCYSTWCHQQIHFPQKNGSKQEAFRIQKVECNPIILISVWFSWNVFWPISKKNAKQDTKPTLLSVTPTCATATNKTGEPPFRWDALQIHQTTALERLPRKLLIHQGVFGPSNFRGAAKHKQQELCPMVFVWKWQNIDFVANLLLRPSQRRQSSKYRQDKFSTEGLHLMNIPHLWRQHGPGKSPGHGKPLCQSVH